MSTFPAEAAPARAEPRITATFELPRAVHPAEELVLTPAGDAARLRVERSEEGQALRPLPLTTDTLPLGSVEVFGAEERCRAVARDGVIHLECSSGSAPAGLLVRFAARYPNGAQAQGRLVASGGDGFAAELVTVGADAERPVAIGARTSLELPRGSPQAAQLVVLAPAAGGRLHISQLSFEPVALPSAGVAGGWAWEPDLWLRRGSELIAAAAQRRLDRLYITLAIAGGRVRHQPQLIRFIREAHARGIAVEAVEGDPEMVTPPGLRSALARARAIAAFQRVAPPDAKLAQVQYDIEPYTLRSWGKHPADYRGWARAVRALAAATGRPVHLVLPFWIADDEGGVRLLREVGDSVSGVTAMAYRSDPAAIAAIAEPLLAWGVAADRPVRVALEAGPVAAEVEERFRSASVGRLAVLPSAAGSRALLLDEAGKIEGAQMFASYRRVVVEPGRISFLGDEAGMGRAAVRLAAAFGAWSSFAGFSYHGIDWSAAGAALGRDRSAR